MNKRSLGKDYEILAGKLLNHHGYEVIERNYRCKLGEVDIVARKDGYLVFVEVKYRASDKLGDPAEAVNYRKQKQIIKVAGFYMLSHHLPMDSRIRFDVVAIRGEEYKIIENAFFA